MESEDFWKVVQANRVDYDESYDDKHIMTGKWYYPFGCRDLYIHVRPTRIVTDRKVIEKYTHNHHFYRLLAMIFKKLLRHVVDDIIDNNDVFMVKKGMHYMLIQMEKVPMDYVIMDRKRFGRFDNLDMYESGGNAYGITAKFSSKGGIENNKVVYVSKEDRRRIDELTNKGRQW